MMKTNHENSNLFVRYLLSYLFILLLPIVVTAFFIFSYFMNILKDEVITNNLNNLNRFKNIVDQQLLGLQNTSNQIMFVNNTLKPFTLLQEDPLKDWKIIQELQNYKATNRFIHEIMIYFRGESFLYTNNSRYTFPMFTDHIYQFKDWKQDGFYKDLNSANSITVRPVEDKADNERYISLIYPTLPNNVGATVLFLVKESTIHDLLKDYKSKIANNLIFDQNDQLVSRFGSEEFDSNSAQLTDLIRLNPQELSRTVTINNKDFFLFSLKSLETGWKYVTLIPVSLVMTKVTTVQTGLLYGLIAILLLGGIAIFLSMNMNYKPIEKMRDALAFLSLRNSELSEKVENNNTAAKDYLMFSLLKGQIQAVEEFNDKGRDIGLNFTNPLLRVVILAFDGQLHAGADKRHLLKTVEQTIPAYFEGYPREHMVSDRLVLILSEGDDDTGLTDQKLFDFHQDLIEQLGNGITMGVGNGCTLFNQAPKSFLEASTALDYRFIKGTNRVIYFHEIIVNQDTLQAYPHHQLEELKKGLKRANTKQVERAIEKLLNYIMQNNTPLFMARGLCFDLIHAVSQTFKELGNHSFVSTNEYPDVFTLEKFETVEDFTSLIKIICNDISSDSDKEEPSDEIELVNRMISYIQEHYMESQFSLKEMSQYFDMAQPNSSQYFKDRTGQTILDFTTKLRMDKAMLLLKSDKIPLKNVAEEVGYYNVSSFIRRFKQVTGMTPGEFRNNHTR
jgi:two-component system response regulator YesN